MAKKNLRDLLARHLNGDDPAQIDAEEERFAGLSPAMKALVLERLEVIDWLQSLERQTVEDAERAAAKLGMGRRNLYRIISRMREHGPVVALTPNARLTAGSSGPKVGLDPIAEEAIAGVLADRPDAPVSAVMAAISLAYNASRSNSKPPSEATVRRRLAVLRKPGGMPDKGGWRSTRRFGRRILIDQSAVVSVPLGIDANAVVVLIVDMDTRLVIGGGEARFDDQSVGLRAAITHARKRYDMIVGGFRVAPDIELIRWVVPDDLLEGSDAWGPDLALGDTIATLTSGTRRHGQRLVQLMGPEFDVFTFMPRVIGEGRRRVGDPPAPATSDFTAEVQTAVSRWNYRILEAASGLEPTNDKEEQRRRLEAWQALESPKVVRSRVLDIARRVERALDIQATNTVAGSER